MKCSHEMAVAATSFRAHACWQGRWNRGHEWSLAGAKLEGLLDWSFVSLVTLRVMRSQFDTFVVPY